MQGQSRKYFGFVTNEDFCNPGIFWKRIGRSFYYRYFYSLQCCGYGSKYGSEIFGWVRIQIRVFRHVSDRRRSNYSLLILNFQIILSKKGQRIITSFFFRSLCTCNISPGYKCVKCRGSKIGMQGRQKIGVILAIKGWLSPLHLVCVLCQYT